MKTLFLSLAILAISIAAVSQSVKVDYYKDFYKHKVASEKKAKYKEVSSKNEDGVKTIAFYGVKDNMLYRISNYLDDQPVGIWKAYDKKGNLINERNFDELVYETPKKEEKDSMPLDTINLVYPTYGSETDRITYLMRNVSYPKEAVDRWIQGTVYLTFVISKEGDVTQIKIIKSVNPFLDYEAYRVIKAMGKWKPATKDGKPIEMTMSMPIKFTLAG